MNTPYEVRRLNNPLGVSGWIVSDAEGEDVGDLFEELWEAYAWICKQYLTELQTLKHEENE